MKPDGFFFEYGRFYWVFTGLILGFTGLNSIFAGFYLVSLVLLVLLGFTGFYWVLLGFTGFYWVLLGFTGFYEVLPSFPGCPWINTGFCSL